MSSGKRQKAKEKVRRRQRQAKADGGGRSLNPRASTQINLLSFIHNLAPTSGRRDSTTCGGFFSSPETSRSISFNSEEDRRSSQSASLSSLTSSGSSEWSDWEDPMWVKDDDLLHTSHRFPHPLRVASTDIEDRPVRTEGGEANDGDQVKAAVQQQRRCKKMRRRRRVIPEEPTPASEPDAHLGEGLGVIEARELHPLDPDPPFLSDLQSSVTTISCGVAPSSYSTNSSTLSSPLSSPQLPPSSTLDPAALPGREEEETATAATPTVKMTGASKTRSIRAMTTTARMRHKEEEWRERVMSQRLQQSEMSLRIQQRHESTATATTFSDAAVQLRKWPMARSQREVGTGGRPELAGRRNRAQDIQIIREMIEENMKLTPVAKLSTEHDTAVATNNDNAGSLDKNDQPLGWRETKVSKVTKRNTNTKWRSLRLLKANVDDEDRDVINRTTTANQEKDLITASNRRKKKTGAASESAPANLKEDTSMTGRVAKYGLHQSLSMVKIPALDLISVRPTGDGDLQTASAPATARGEDEMPPATRSRAESLTSSYDPTRTSTSASTNQQKKKKRKKKKKQNVPNSPAPSVGTLGGVGEDVDNNSSCGTATPGLKTRAATTPDALLRPRDDSDPTFVPSSPRPSSAQSSSSSRRVWLAMTTPVTAAGSRFRRQSRRCDTGDVKWVRSPLVELLGQRHQERQPERSAVH